MSTNLHRAVRETYNEAVLHHRNPKDAFEAAFKVFCRERPEIAAAQARHEVARMLAIDPDDRIYAAVVDAPVESS
jgi:hypothetical protein